MKKIWIVICLLVAGLSLDAQTKYQPIEELVYTGYYNWGFLWVKAGRVEFSLKYSVTVFIASSSSKPP